MPKDTHVLPKDHTQSCPLFSTHMAFLKKKKERKKKPAFSTLGPVSLVGSLMNLRLRCQHLVILWVCFTFQVGSPSITAQLCCTCEELFLSSSPELSVFTQE